MEINMTAGIIREEIEKAKSAFSKRLAQKPEPKSEKKVIEAERLIDFWADLGIRFWSAGLWVAVL